MIPNPCCPAAASSHPTSRCPGAPAGSGRYTTNRLPVAGTVPVACNNSLPEKWSAAFGSPSTMTVCTGRRIHIGNWRRALWSVAAIRPQRHLPSVIGDDPPVIGPQPQDCRFCKRFRRWVASPRRAAIGRPVR